MSCPWELSQHQREVGLAQLPAHAPFPRWAFEDADQPALWSITRTVDELSVICTYDDIPGSVPSAGPFTVFSVDGPLDHTLVGVLAGLLQPLADAGISILAESTYDTDWILVPSAQADQARTVWQSAGHTVEEEEPR